MFGSLIGMATLQAASSFDATGIGAAQKYMMGMAPVVGLSAGDSITYSLAETNGKLLYEFGGLGYDSQGKPVNLSKINAVNQSGKAVDLSKIQKPGLGSAAMSAIGPLMSGVFIYQGFKEDGFAGAMDAYFLDVATSRGIHNEVYDIKKDLVKNTVTHTRRLGMLGTFGASAGAFMGYELGNQIAGVPGGFVGASLGAKVLPAFGANPLGMGMLVLGGLAAKKAGEQVVSKVGHIVKKGYQRGKMKHRIDTAGSTAAFFTQNAITTRGRAFEAMRKSHLNARSALGMEATMTHMNRSYF